MPPRLRSSFLLVPQADRLPLGEEVERARAFHLAQLAKTEQPTRGRLEIEHPPSQRVVTKGIATRSGVLGDDLLRLLLRPDEQDHPAAAAEIAYA